MATEITNKEEKQTTKVILLTDLKASKNEQIIKWVEEYDVVILRLRQGSIRLSPVKYS